VASFSLQTRHLPDQLRGFPHSNGPQRFPPENLERGLALQSTYSTGRSSASAAIIQGIFTESPEFSFADVNFQGLTVPSIRRYGWKMLKRKGIEKNRPHTLFVITHCYSLSRTFNERAQPKNGVEHGLGRSGTGLRRKSQMYHAEELSAKNYASL